MLLADVFFHPQESSLVCHEHLQIPAYKLRNIIVQKTLFRLSLMRLLLLDTPDEPLREILIVHDYYITAVDEEIHPISAPQYIQQLGDAESSDHTVLLVL